MQFLFTFPHGRAFLRPFAAEELLWLGEEAWVGSSSSYILLIVSVGFLSSLGTNGMGIMAKTKRRVAMVPLLRKELIRVSPHLHPKRTKSYSFMSKSVQQL